MPSLSATAARLDQRADLGQLLPLAVLADAADDEHVAVPRPGRLLSHEFDARGRIDRRLGLGQAGD